MEDGDIDTYLCSMQPINKLVDAIPRQEQYSHIFGRVYGLDYAYYQIQYDAMIIAGEFDCLWKELYGNLPNKQDNHSRVYKRHIYIDELINIKCRCSDKFITSKELYSIHGCSLKKATKYVREHYDDFLAKANQELWDYYQENGQNLIDHFAEKWIVGDKVFFAKYTKEYKQNFKQYREEIQSDEYITNHLCRFKVNKRDLLFYKSWYEYKYIETDTLFNGILSVVLMQLMRDFENNFRKIQNMPNIGEGWVSERG